MVKHLRIRGHWPKLIEALQTLDQPFAMCYEASCGYGHLYDQLSRIARRVVAAHPGQLRLIFRSKKKNDRVDAKKLATLLFLDQVPTIDKKIGRAPATEVLINNASVKDKIRHGEENDLPTIVATATAEGMRNFTQSLAEMIEQELIYYDTAMEYAPNRNALESAVKGIKMSQQSIVRLRGK